LNRWSNNNKKRWSCQNTLGFVEKIKNIQMYIFPF
jgi:hypothetical protein